MRANTERPGEGGLRHKELLAGDVCLTEVCPAFILQQLVTGSEQLATRSDVKWDHYMR